jgi:large subunit ribosomal protein L24
MRLRSGDRVKVLSGKEKGKEGTVARVFPEANKVIVDGLNIVKKHQKAQGQTRQAGIIDREMPMHASNVAIVSPADGKPTRIGYRIDEQGEKHRICKRSGSDL